MPSIEGIIVFSTPEEARKLLSVPPSHQSTSSRVSEIQKKEKPMNVKNRSPSTKKKCISSTASYSPASEAVLRHYDTLLAFLRQRFHYEAAYRGCPVGYSVNDYSFLQAISLPSKTVEEDACAMENIYLVRIEEGGFSEQTSWYFIDVDDLYTAKGKLRGRGGSPEGVDCDGDERKKSLKRRRDLTPQGGNTSKRTELDCAFMKANSDPNKGECVEEKGTPMIIEAARNRCFSILNDFSPKESWQLTRNEAEGLPKVIVVALCDRDFPLFSSVDCLLALPQFITTFARPEALSSEQNDENRSSVNIVASNSISSKGSFFAVKGYPRIFQRNNCDRERDSQASAPPLTPPEWLISKGADDSHFPPGVQVVRSAFVISSLHFGTWCVPGDFTWDLHLLQNNDGTPDGEINPFELKDATCQPIKVGQFEGVDSLDQLIQDTLATCLPYKGLNILAQSTTARPHSGIAETSPKLRSKDDLLFTDSPFPSYRFDNANKNADTSLYECKMLSPWGWVSQTELMRAWKVMLEGVFPFSSSPQEDDLLSFISVFSNPKSRTTRQSNLLFHENVERILQDVNERYVQGIKNKNNKSNLSHLDEFSSPLWICQKVLQQGLLLSEKFLSPQKDSYLTPFNTPCESYFQQNVLEQLRYLESSSDMAVFKILRAYRGLFNYPFPSLSRKRTRHPHLHFPLSSLDFSLKWLRRFVRAPCILLASLAEAEDGPQTELKKSLLEKRNDGAGLARCLKESEEEEEEEKSPELADFAQLVFLTNALPGGHKKPPSGHAGASAEGGISSFTAASLGLLDNPAGRAIAAAANAFFFNNGDNNGDTAENQSDKEDVKQTKGKTLTEEANWSSRPGANDGEGGSSSEPFCEKEKRFEDSALIGLQQKAVYFAVEMDQPNTLHLIRLLECFLNPSAGPGEQTEEVEAAAFNSEKVGANLRGLSFDPLGSAREGEADGAAFSFPFQLPPPALAALRQYWDHIAEEANDILESFFEEEAEEGDEFQKDTDASEQDGTWDAAPTLDHESFAACTSHERETQPADGEASDGGAEISSSAHRPSFKNEGFNVKAAWRTLTGLEALKLYMQQTIAQASSISTAKDNSMLYGGDNEMYRIPESEERSNICLKGKLTPTNKQDGHWLRHALFILSYGAGDALEYLRSSDITEIAAKTLEKKLGDRAPKSNPNNAKSNNLKKKTENNEMQRIKKAPRGELQLQLSRQLAVMRAARTHYLAFCETIVSAYETFLHCLRAVSTTEKC